MSAVHVISVLFLLGLFDVQSHYVLTVLLYLHVQSVHLPLTGDILD